MLVDEPGDPAWNMSVDGALLAVGAAPTLRLYGWRPHAVSLGYFQSLSAFADLPDGTAVVRRATGGGAIHHGDELTYALAVDADLLPKDLAESYRLLHDAIQRALGRIGVACRRATEGRLSARPDDPWCFSHPVQGDLVTDRGKLCGSAQRRAASPRPRVLHHGSLVLRRPALTPFVAAVEDQVEPSADVQRRLRRAVADEIGDALGMSPEPGALNAQERAVASELLRDVFGAAAHLRRR